MTSDPESARLGVLDFAGAAASGVLTAIAFPKFDLMFFAWISLLPLIFLLAKARPGQGFRLGWTGGAVFYGILLYWIPNVPAHFGGLPVPVSLLIYLLFILVLGLTWALFGLGMALLRRRFGPIAFYLAPFLWVTLEYGVSHVLTGFPWGVLGVSQYKNVAFIQVAAVTGVYGISFFLILFQSLFAASITYMKRVPFALGMLAMAAVHIGGFLTIKPIVPGPGTFRAAAVQGNTSPDIDWGRYGVEKTRALFDEYLKLTRQAKAEGADLIVWPEFSVPMCLACGDAESTRFENALTGFVWESRATLLVGAVEAAPGANAARYYNAALQISPDRAVSKYAKMHLVPFGEYIPYPRILGFVEKLAPAVGAFTPGRSRTLHAFRDVPYGSPICYEIVFPDEVRRFVRKGARFLVTITNDGWYGASAAPRQHFAQAVLRAAENRRFVLRSATTGISGLIDPYGRVVRKTGIGVPALLTGDVTPSTGLTFYARFGDVFSLASLAAAGLALILTFLKRRP